MKSRILFVVFIAFSFIGCEKGIDVKNFSLENTAWFSPDSKYLSFSDKSFVYDDIDYKYFGNYNLLSNSGKIQFTFDNADKSLTARLTIQKEDTIIECEGEYYYRVTNTYSALRSVEDARIDRYIKRNKLNIVQEEPAEDYEWNGKDYYKVRAYDNMYFHLRKRGNNQSELKIGDNLSACYQKFELTVNADTTSVGSVIEQSFPCEFIYGNTSTCDAIGWHVAVKLMKYSDAECEIIVPSKCGFSDDQCSVTPYVYILHIKAN